MDLAAVNKLNWGVAANVSAFVTTRAEGFSQSPYASFNLAMHVGDSSESVLKNRQLLRGYSSKKLHWQYLKQVHTCNILLINEPQQFDAKHDQAEPEADAIVCRVPGVACCILTADCLPVFMADRNGNEVAIVHAGWRGLAAGILEQTIAQMRTAVEDIQVYLGPAIGPCHFEVGEDVRAKFLQQEENQKFLQATKDCFSEFVATDLAQIKYLANLYKLAKIRLHKLGINQISGGEECTYCEEAHYFSFRRDGVTGRILNMIYLDEADH